MSDPREHNHEINAEVTIDQFWSVVGWGAILLMLVLVIDTYWMKRVDCALGVQPACAAIERHYQAASEPRR